MRLYGIGSLLLLAAMPCAGSTASMVQDFARFDPATTKHSAAAKATSATVSAAVNSIDGSRALAFSVSLEGEDAGWAGCSLPVSGQVPAGADAVEFDARAGANTRALWITLTERDGSRWNASVSLDDQWKHFSVPCYRFQWFMGPSAREKSVPNLQAVVSVDPWVGNMFQGPNGFEIDNVSIVDTVPPMAEISLVSPVTTVSLQRETRVRIEAHETTGGARSKFTGTVLLDVPDRNMCIVPSRVEMRDGVAEFEAFPRNPGAQEIFVYEPFNRCEGRLALNVVKSCFVRPLTFDLFEGEQVVFTNIYANPSVKFVGGGALPATAHIEVRNHTGKLIASQNASMTELISHKFNMAIPEPGMLSVDIAMLTEPLSLLPHVPGNFPVSVKEVDPYASLPEGVTTDVVMASVVKLESLPTTASVLMRDRFTLWSLMVSPQENSLYKSPFGLCSGALFHLTPDEIQNVGMKRLRWHRKLGSLWGRNDLWWRDIEPTSGTFTWDKADKVVEAYQVAKIRLMGILNNGPAWSTDSPADEAARAKWCEWVSAVFQRYKSKMHAYELWNEPNGNFWAPAPSLKAYRELMRVTYPLLQQFDGAIWMAAGATAGFDPVFIDGILRDGSGRNLDVLSFHPYPDRPYESPDKNYLGEVCSRVRASLKQYGLADKQAWITELGWSTNPAGCTEEEQANYLVRAYTIALHERINKLFWFDLYDWTPLPWRGTGDAHLGLLDWNYRPKPAAIAYNMAAFMLSHMSARENGKSRQGKATIYSFDIMTQSYKFPGTMHVAWTQNPGETEDIELPCGAGGGVLAIDYLGSQHTPTLVDDKSTTSTDDSTTKTWRIRTGYEPMYIWDVGADPRKKVRK